MPVTKISDSSKEQSKHYGDALDHIRDLYVSVSETLYASEDTPYYAIPEILNPLKEIQAKVTALSAELRQVGLAMIEAENNAPPKVSMSYDIDITWWNGTTTNKGYKLDLEEAKQYAVEMWDKYMAQDEEDDPEGLSEAGHTVRGIEVVPSDGSGSIEYDGFSWSSVG